MVCGAFFFGSKFGEYEEKMAWVEQRELENIEWQKELKELKASLVKKELAVKKELVVKRENK